MCLAMPMKVVSLDGNECFVEAGGLKRKVNLAFLKDVKQGDYILLHAGFAIERLKPEEAKKTLRVLKEL